jgi:hypothetical protein
MPNVVLSWIDPGTVPSRFAASLAYLLQHDAEHEGYLLGAGGTINLQSGPRIAEARCQVVDHFGKPEYAGADWLLMLDSDMTFEPDLLVRLLAVADPEEVPVLGGLCFAGGRSGRMYPTLYKEGVTDEGHIWVEPVDNYPPNALVKVGGTGGACLLIHRQVLAAMKRPYPDGFGTMADGRYNPYPWFVEGLVGPNGEPYGEDIAFCLKCRQLGIPVHVHTGIQLGHVKAFELNEDEWRRHTVEKATTNGATRQQRRQAARQRAKIR